jgi:type VI secretion system protein ImpE
LLRQLLRAEVCRQQFHEAGRLPEFVAEPSQLLQLHLRASICIREGEAHQAADLLARAEALRPQLHGTCDGEEFEDLRDLDDLLAPLLEALTSTGKYYWIPISEVQAVELPDPRSLFDLLWRPVRLSVRQAPPGVVFLPALYVGGGQDEREAVRLGQATEWLGGDDNLVRGRGLRMFMVGEEAKSIMEITRLDVRDKSS